MNYNNKNKKEDKINNNNNKDSNKSNPFDSKVKAAFDDIDEIGSLE